MTNQLTYKLLIPALALLWLWSGCASEPSAPAHPAPAVHLSDQLLEVDKLQEMLQSANPPIVLDIRKPDVYDEGHIPGAHHVWRHDFQSEDFAFSGMIGSKDLLVQLLNRVGAVPSSTIVLYDNRGNGDAAKLWWILKMYGHHDVKLVNGDFSTWKAANYPTSTKVPKVASSDYRFVKPSDFETMATQKMVKEALTDDSWVLVDTRSLEEYSGEMQKSGSFRAGHIPGAVWYDFNATLDDLNQNRFKSVEQLKEDLAKLGVTPDKQVICYCHSGARSAQVSFVLRELLEFQHVYNYDGSWIEWSYIKELPIETGA